MADRRSLTDALKDEPPIDKDFEREFVYQKKQPAAKPKPPAKTSTPLPAANPAAQGPRIPLTARIPADMFYALKRASFQRQLEGVEPNTFQDIVEEALTPWLRKHGYLP